MDKVCGGEGGQATVEAAFLIPVLFVVLLVLMQPAMVLYDRMVMAAAATDACRLLATKTDAAGESAQAIEAFVRHRLGAVPPVDCFHVHEGECSWRIDAEGDERSERVRVSIENKVRPLPLLDGASALLGLLDEEGMLTVKVEAERKTQPDWVREADVGPDPQGWIGAWS